MRQSIGLILFTILALNSQAQQEKTTTQKEKKNKGTIYTFVEQPPQFPGNDAALVKFLQKNIVYPKADRDNNVMGKVFIKFVVDEKGRIRDPQVTRGVSETLDAEALRVIKLLPKFIPGKQNGKPVKVYYNIPIVFKLQ